MEPETVANALAAGREIDFSVTALFLRASFIVQLTIVLMAAASIWSWTIIVAKLLRFARARGEADRFEAAFWSGQPLDELHARLGERPASSLERIFVAGMNEWRKSHGAGGLIPGAEQRIERVMTVAIRREAEGLERRLGVLASTAATTPFIGLFGTVWGVKNSFEAIALMQNTNLAVVAPGIAEALLTTAIGLLAAVPAVIFYNKLSADAERLIGRMEGFADEFGAILDRQMQKLGA
ncbi:MAG: protein TolQ [Paracoccaceae bacterium]